MPDPIDIVLAYHQRTKHQFNRYAAGPDGLDWANQPDPFRVFAGCPQVALPLLGTRPTPPYPELYSTERVPAEPLNLLNIAALLELAFGLSAWKQYGESRWALRCNPSSGNLHPTEAYLVTAGCDGLSAGVHHYLSRDHLLEQRCAFVPDDQPPALPTDSLLLGLTSIHWREAWKYGERAFRYCQHDIGHAVAALRYAAATLGWRVRLLDHWGDDAIATLLGCGRTVDFGEAEGEQPDLVLHIGTGDDATPVDTDRLIAAARTGHWQGRANRLSESHRHHWPQIDVVTAACHKPATPPADWRPPALPAPTPSACPLSAATVIRQRRSAQSLDGVTGMDVTAFHRLLDMTLPRPDVVPWDGITWAPRIHLLLFVHRVDGLTPGLYLLPRLAGTLDTLKAAIGRDLEWQPVDGAPPHLGLLRLLAADAREAAQTLSCHQAIAADGAFSVAMLAEYDANLVDAPWRYRQLYWEAGMIGQVLYLEAEAAGLQGTGIGCYFDDGVHDMLALSDTTLQSLYHFTVGGALTDARLQTLPPYAHLGVR